MKKPGHANMVWLMGAGRAETAGGSHLRGLRFPMVYDAFLAGFHAFWGLFPSRAQQIDHHDDDEERRQAFAKRCQRQYAHEEDPCAGTVVHCWLIAASIALNPRYISAVIPKPPMEASMPRMAVFGDLTSPMKDRNSPATDVIGYQ